MAERRMFSKSVIGSARFLRMPPSSRLLYYDLGMAADDDGVVEAFSVMRMTGAVEDDLKVLVSKGFITVLNEDLVAYIEDWSKNNQIRKDRYHPSIYQNLLVQIGAVNQLETVGQPDGNQRLTQDSIVQVITLPSDSTVPSSDKPESEKRTKKVFPPDSDAYQAACCLRDEIAQRLPTASPPSEKQMQAWADAFDKCHRLDGHDWSEIERVLLFSQDDPFWQKNILSGEKFRRQYTALLARMGGG